MSFITIIKAEATELEQDVIAGIKAAANYVDNVFVQDVEPILLTAFAAAIQLVERNGGALLLTAAQDAVGALTDPGLTLAEVGVQIVEAAKVAGAATIAAEEQLAAQTAVQIVQAVKGVVAA